MMLIIDTGGVYLLTIAVQLVLYVMGSEAIQIVISALSQITGIVPTLIIVCGAIGKKQYTERHPMQPTQLPISLRDTQSIAPRVGLEKHHSISPPSPV